MAASDTHAASFRKAYNKQHSTDTWRYFSIMSKTGKINKKTLLYLNQLTNFVDCFPAPVNNILKTSYMAKCDFIENASNFSKAEDYLTIICPTCNVNISETATFQLIAKKCSTKFTKLLKKRLENGSYLTNYQKRYTKRFPVTSDDGHVAFNITCNVCNKSIKRVISKWKRPSTKRAAPEELDARRAVQNSPKRKKKRVDRTCGLSVEAIESVQNKNIQMGEGHKNGKKTIALPKEPPKQQRPVIINNNNSKKKPINDVNREILKNNKKLGEILGISLTHNSHKPTSLGNFFDSF